MKTKLVKTLQVLAFILMATMIAVANFFLDTPSIVGAASNIGVIALVAFSMLEIIISMRKIDLNNAESTELSTLRLIRTKVYDGREVHPEQISDSQAASAKADAEYYRYYDTARPLAKASARPISDMPAKSSQGS